MSTQHTPGPWRVGDREPYVEVWGPMRMNSHPILASIESEPREANARLMAAAPDMLAALNELLGKLEVMGGCNAHDMNGESIWPEFEAARAAIAKAEQS